jgi:hypothetical protein
VFLASTEPGGAFSADRAGIQHHASFVAGGVGASSQEELKAREREFNLKLVFTLVEGNYVADVNVVIRDAGGRSVLEHVAPGPLLMAKLPRGTYTVSATYEGRTQSRKVSIGERLRTEQFRWPSNPHTDFPLQNDRG